jgi:hypothetical protein
MVPGGGERLMTQKKIQEAQDYLTMMSENRMRRIVDIETLLRKHLEPIVLTFLRNLLREKEKILKGLIVRDKKNAKINETVVAMFRLYMAIKTMENGKEVKGA